LGPRPEHEAGGTRRGGERRERGGVAQERATIHDDLSVVRRDPCDGARRYRDSPRRQIGRADASRGEFGLRPISGGRYALMRMTGSGRTTPISQHSSPRRRNASATEPARPAATENRSPPEVSDSVSSETR